MLCVKPSRDSVLRHLRKVTRRRKNPLLTFGGVPDHQHPSPTYRWAEQLGATHTPDSAPLPEGPQSPKRRWVKFRSGLRHRYWLRMDTQRGRRGPRPAEAARPAQGFAGQTQGQLARPSRASPPFPGSSQGGRAVCAEGTPSKSAFVSPQSSSPLL